MQHLHIQQLSEDFCIQQFSEDFCVWHFAWTSSHTGFLWLCTKQQIATAPAGRR